MKPSLKVTLVVLAVAIPAFALGAGTPPGEAMWRAIWPWDTESANEPSGVQLAFFVLLAALEAVALGVAVAFLAFGRPAVRRLAGGGWRFGALYGGTAWLLGNWWAHAALHIVNGESLTGLLVIEYAFHVTLIAAGALVIGALASLVRETRAAPARPAARPTRA